MDLGSPFRDCPLILDNQRQVTRLKMAVVRAPLRVPCNSNAIWQEKFVMSVAYTLYEMGVVRLSLLTRTPGLS